MTTLPPLAHSARSAFVHLSVMNSALRTWDVTKLESWREVKKAAMVAIAENLGADKVRLIKFRVMRSTEHDLPGTAYTVYIRAEEIL